jgi:hypothetical protein
MPEEYFVVRNDRPLPAVAAREPAVICGEVDAPDQRAVYDRTEKERAFEQRDKLREAYENPYINVYRMTLEPVNDPRDAGDA